MRYDFSAVEILKVLGYDKPVGKETLHKWMKEQGVTFPKVYCEFMELAMDCEMLETSDMWIGKMINFVMKPRFFYDEIREMIEDRQNVGECYYPFLQLPENRWGELSSDYLYIGSDYGAGVVCFAIRREDLEQDDPPVYMNHEANPITDWRQMYPKLSDYLLEVVLNALNCQDYSTAMEVLEKRGYCYLNYEEYEMGAYEGKEEKDLEESDILAEEEWQERMFDESGIDLDKVNKRMNTAGINELFCCYDEEKKYLYVGGIEDEDISLLIIYKKV